VETYLIDEAFPPPTRKSHEKELKGLEEAWKTTLEMAKKENAAPKESTKDAQVLSQSSAVGVWGNSASSRAPVTGMITNGYSERSGDVHSTMMNNWSDDP